MATFKQQIKQLDQEQESFLAKRKALYEAMESALADRVCLDVGEHFRAHMLNMPMKNELALKWRQLGGSSQLLNATTDAFAEAMVKHGYFIRKEMYGATFGDKDDVELSQEKINRCVCPFRGVKVVKQDFEKNRYPLWETTAKWSAAFQSVKDSEMPVCSELSMKIFDADGDGCYAANSAEEFRAWYIEKYGAECAEYVEELVELTLEEAGKRMIFANHDREKLSLLCLLDQHVRRNGKVIAMLSCESH